MLPDHSVPIAGPPIAASDRPFVPFTVRAMALTAALLVSACGGGGSDGPNGTAAPAADPPGTAVTQAPVEGPAPSPSPPAPPPGPAPKENLQASQPGQLMAYVKGKLDERQKLREQAKSNDVDFSTSGNPVPAGAVFSAGAAPPPVERSGTVVQEEGIDEEDSIKSDGAAIYTLLEGGINGGHWQPKGIAIHRLRADGGTESASRWQLGTEPNASVSYTGMYLNGASKRLAALGSISRFSQVDLCAPAASCASASLLPTPPFFSKPSVAVEVVEVADAGRPLLGERLRIDGKLVGSRMVGDSLVLVTQFTPALQVDALPWNAPAEERAAAIARVKPSDLLPTITSADGASQPLVAETDCYIEPQNANYGIDVTSITVIDLSSGNLKRSSRCFIGGTDSIYMSRSALYLATSNARVMPAPVFMGSGTTRLTFPPDATTDIHKFALSGGTGGTGGSPASVEYRGSGQVPGHLGWSTQQRPYRMGEHNGDLRVLTFTGPSGWGALEDAANPGAPKPSPATLTVLRETAGAKALRVVGQLPNSRRPSAIGKPGEQVYAVRFIGDKGYVVTFRRTDPLYVLDLSDPADPNATGELTVAGFSDYLFPIGPAGSGLLLGVGRDAAANGDVLGVKVALFDVADPAKPAQVGTATIGGRYAYSALEQSSHGIDLFTRGGRTRVVLPVVTYGAPAYEFSMQRFEVDSASRTLKPVNPLKPPGVGDSYLNLGLFRTLQVGDKLHYFDGVSLGTSDW